MIEQDPSRPLDAVPEWTEYKEKKHQEYMEEFRAEQAKKLARELNEGESLTHNPELDDTK